jgi:hypothetical protein
LISKHTGRWLSIGLAAVHRLSIILIMLSLGGVVWLFFLGSDSEAMKFIGDLGDESIIFASGAALLVLLRGALAPIRSGLDLVLDVVNYLRRHPKDATPRARISARFACLQRYLAKDYDAVVFVAQSQGTVITIDALRLGILDVDKDFPRALLTTGCPLRQLYDRFLPLLVPWVGQEPGDGKPDPAILDVVQWVNLYRSGDYVGRSLWTLPKDAKRWKPGVDRKPHPNVLEACLPPGAHLAYWNGSEPRVSRELMGLVHRVREASSGPTTVPDHP